MSDNGGVSSGDPFFRIRATRAKPPDLASTDDQRRKTYGAALSQFDELMATAIEASARSRPLPLFYALSQAGRAISAAHGGEAWKLRGHGLSAPELDCADVCEVKVKPARSSSGETTDSFSGVATACGSGLLAEPASIGELWSSLPGVSDLLTGDQWLRPLQVFVDETTLNHPLHDFGHVTGYVIGLRGKTPEEAFQELADYPMAQNATVREIQGIFADHLTPLGHGKEVRWPTGEEDFFAWQRTLDEVLPKDRLTDGRWLRPAVAQTALSQLMTWWTLLYGLSMLARYEPGSWVTALDLDQPGLAAQLAELLDVAVEAIPSLIIEALTCANSSRPSP